MTTPRPTSTEQFTRPGGLAGTAWMARASCASPPARDLPWTTDTHRLTRTERDALAAVCHTCPVRDACEAYTRTARITGGYWAGHDRDPRARNRRRERLGREWIQDSLPGLTPTNPTPDADGNGVDTSHTTGRVTTASRPPRRPRSPREAA